MALIKKTAALLIVAGALVVGGLTLIPDTAQAMSVPATTQLVTQSATAPWWGPHHRPHGWWRHHRPYRHWRHYPRRPYRWARPWRRHRCVWKPGFWRWGVWHRGRRVCW
jgi:hypothetical protein